MDKEFIKEYFGKHWTSRTAKYLYSNHSIAEKIQPGDHVIDVGCGNNEFKTLIPNLLGIDIVNPQADIIIDFDEFDTDHQFDVALCLGSIQYGTRDDIERQLKKLSNLVRSGGRVYWRTNTGVKDHKNDLVDRVPYYPWTEQTHYEFAQQFGFKCELVKEDLHGRLYAEWRRL
jgi:cyclopropane fatty-acyl-phospholipid synthase-like methyltransferase